MMKMSLSPYGKAILLEIKGEKLRKITRFLDRWTDNLSKKKVTLEDLVELLREYSELKASIFYFIKSRDQEEESEEIQIQKMFSEGVILEEND